MNLSLDLQKIFPLTFVLLGEEQATALSREFEVDFGPEKLHFFPMFIRQKKLPLEVIEVADYEYLVDWLETSSFAASSATAHLALEPSVQFVLIQSATDCLEKEAGVYLLWKTREQVFEKMLSHEEALFMDRLREDQILFEKDLTDIEKVVCDNFHELGILKPTLRD